VTQAPTKGEIVESKETALLRLQDWAFTYGFALAIESGTADRVRFQCIHHKRDTRNTRKTLEEARKRVETKTQSRSCKFGLYISKQKRLGNQWGIRPTHLKHNHAPNPDPFQYIQHRSKRISYTKAITIAATHSRVISYTASAEILRKDGLEVDRKQYYSLH
jgi:hypothetical protein